MKSFTRCMIVATLAVGSLVSTVAANAQPTTTVYGNSNDKYHVIYDNPKNGDVTTWYSNNYCAMLMLAERILASLGHCI